MTLPLTVLGILKAEWASVSLGGLKNHKFLDLNLRLPHSWCQEWKGKSLHFYHFQGAVASASRKPHFENHHPARHRNDGHRKQGRINRPGGWWRYAANPPFLKSDYVFFQGLKWPPNPPRCHFLPYCCSSVTQSRPTLCNSIHCNMPGFPVLHHLPELAQTHVPRVSDASNSLVLCCLLLLPPSIFPSIKVFSNESSLHIRWPKYWSFNINPSNEYSGLISFRIDWFDLLAVQGTLKSLLQHHSLKVSIVWSSDFLMVLLSHPYMTTGETIVLTRWTFVSKIMSCFLICCLG